MSAAGSRRRGFTLLELLVVMAIVAMASAGVGFALRDTSQVQLHRDAERLAAVLESARARSRVTGLTVRWRPTADGFRFEGLPHQTNDANALPERWLDQDTGVAGDPLLTLGPEPIIGPQALELLSRSQPTRRVRVATDGVRPFTVQPALP